MALTKIQGSGISNVTISADGEVTKAAQPAFSVHKNNTGQDNLAADSSSVVITFGTETYDIGSNFASNTFTAPVTGKYQLSLRVGLNQVDRDANYVFISINTSNRSYASLIDANFGGADPAYWQVNTTFLVDMDANDTANCLYQQSGGEAQIDINGAQNYTNFSGFLAC